MQDRLVQNLEINKQDCTYLNRDSMQITMVGEKAPGKKITFKS